MKNYDLTNPEVKALVEKKRKLETELKEIAIAKQMKELNDNVRWLQDRVNDERKSLQKL